MKNCILFFSLVAVFSCKKTDTTTDLISSRLTGSFITDSILTVSTPLMYTKNSLITDSNFIKSYVSRWTYPCNNCSFSFSSTTEAATFTMKIDFVSLTEGTVQFNTGGQVKYLIQVDNNNAIFISKDTVSLGSGTGECSMVTKKTYVYKAPYDTCFPIYTSSGISYACRSQPVDLVVSANGDLYLPEVKSFTSKTTNSGTCNAFSSVLNVFNANLQSTLGITDTIIVQQKRWNLRKL